MGIKDFFKSDEEKRIKQAELAGIDKEKYKLYLAKRKKELFIERQKLQRQMELEALRTKASLISKQAKHQLKQKYQLNKTPRPSFSQVPDLFGALSGSYQQQSQSKQKKQKKVNILDDSFIMGGIQ